MTISFPNSVWDGSNTTTQTNPNARRAPDRWDYDRIIGELQATQQKVLDEANPPFGHMGATNITQVVTVSLANTPYEITAGLSAGQLNNITFGGNHYLQISVSGIYLVTWNISADTANPGQEIESGILVNGNEEVDVGNAHTYVAAGAASSNMASSGILSLSVNDQVSLFVRNHSGGNNITVEHVHLALVLIKRS